MKYAIITPVRDEEKFIEQTIKSVLAQTVKPWRWIIVDDASRDRTYEIVKEYERKIPWIKAIKKEKSSGLEGGSVPECFMLGVSLLDRLPEFLVKLDGDVTLNPDFFEKILKKFYENPELGIASGGCYHFVDGRWRLEKVPLSHTRGATKVYRRECFKDIGGLVLHLGWDTIDEVKAWMHGWETRSFLEIPFYHHRETGARLGKIKLAKKYADMAYYTGYLPLFFLLGCLKRALHPPSLPALIVPVFHYLMCWLEEKPAYSEKDVRRKIKKEQLKRLLGMETLWK